MTHDPPKHLSEDAKALWAEIVPARCKSAERMALLVVALEAMDRSREAAAIIAKEGMTTKTARSGVTHIHPLVKIERESRQLFAKIWGQLNLQWNPLVDGRMG